MSVADLLKDAVDVIRVNEVGDAIGGWNEYWTLVHRGVCVRIQPISALEQLQWAKVSEQVTHTIYALEQGILAKDQLIFGARGFEIIGRRNIDEYQPARLMTYNAREVVPPCVPSTSTTTSTTSTTTTSTTTTTTTGE